MKLFEARDFNEKISKLKEAGPVSYSLEDLYRMRDVLPRYYQAGFCGEPVYRAFAELLKTAIYEKLNGSTT